MSDLSLAPTVFELVDEVIRPLTLAVPRRLSVRRYYDPDGDPGLPMGPPSADIVEAAERQTRWHAALGAIGLSRDGALTPKAVALFRVMRRGPVRGAVTGLVADRLEPLRLHFFGDQETGAVLEYAGKQVRLGVSPAARLPEQVAARLPAAEPGPGELVRIQADPLGRIAPEAVAELRALAARPRLATMVFDLTVGRKIVAEHPRGAVVLFDTDLGRYLVFTSVGADGRWVLFFAPASGQHVASWIRHSVQTHLEPVCG
ncbi:ESX secretion-associated protein EspG [Amycolatopsis sp. GM8]|uniref:ESX secretion-associated protein EspG n=1 Tax=Amycolatopsis sp. GM8 TaxID=2896530 RepID=UPI001F2FC8A6|nr:ESX secretion-associated protein EspG [Amycolatopsis sp. GM8]